MRYHTQNLNEQKGKVVEPMFWHGRAWFYLLNARRHDETFHVEWGFGKHARGAALTATFGCGDADAGLCLHICLPWVCSLFFVLPYVYRCRESKLGIAIHNQAIWLYTFTDQNESRHDMAWWRKCHSWYFPWGFDHHLTEILEHKANLPGLAKTVWDDSDGRAMLDSWEERQKAQQSVSEHYRYMYNRKRGDAQKVIATVYVTRMTWRARWYPIIWSKKVSTSINIEFDGEVGEETGSWKGGCTGCGYDMLPGETPQETLRRMERERKF